MKKPPKRPRPTLRCCWLSEEGRRCDKAALVRATIFSDSEIRRGWFSVPVCAKHINDL